MTPDLFGEVRGYREWRITARGDGVSPGQLAPWTLSLSAWCSAVERAACYAGGTHEAPDPECVCGLYAWYGPPPRLISTASPSPFLLPLVFGVVAAWGRIQLHADGFRAERMRIDALAISPVAEAILSREQYPAEWFPDVTRMLDAYPPQDMTALLGPVEEARRYDRGGWPTLAMGRAWQPGGWVQSLADTPPPAPTVEDRRWERALASRRQRGTGPRPPRMDGRG